MSYQIKVLEQQTLIGRDSLLACFDPCGVVLASVTMKRGRVSYDISFIDYDDAINTYVQLTTEPIESGDWIVSKHI